MVSLPSMISVPFGAAAASSLMKTYGGPSGLVVPGLAGILLHAVALPAASYVTE